MITRSGRLSKPPIRYEPAEKVEDDYESDEYDSDDSGGTAVDDDVSEDGSDDGSDLESFIDSDEEDED
jgi:hypothetical protein